jgi:hypothetical protein
VFNFLIEFHKLKSRLPSLPQSPHPHLEDLLLSLLSKQLIKTSAKFPTHVIYVGGGGGEGGGSSASIGDPLCEHVSDGQPPEMTDASGNLSLINAAEATGAGGALMLTPDQAKKAGEQARALAKPAVGAPVVFSREAIKRIADKENSSTSEEEKEEMQQLVEKLKSQQSWQDYFTGENSESLYKEGDDDLLKAMEFLGKNIFGVSCVGSLKDVGEFVASSNPGQQMMQYCEKVDKVEKQFNKIDEDKKPHECVSFLNSKQVESLQWERIASGKGKNRRQVLQPLFKGKGGPSGGKLEKVDKGLDKVEGGKEGGEEGGEETKSLLQVQVQLNQDAASELASSASFRQEFSQRSSNTHSHTNTFSSALSLTDGTTTEATIEKLATELQGMCQEYCNTDLTEIQTRKSGNLKKNWVGFEAVKTAEEEKKKKQDEEREKRIADEKARRDKEVEEDEGKCLIKKPEDRRRRRIRVST